MKRRLALVLTIAALALGLTASTASARNPLPLLFIRDLPKARQNPDRSPTGANNWKCKPSAAHPRAVVLVHGTAGAMGTNWGAMSPGLAASGYCVFALNYGGPAKFGYLYGFAPMRSSAKELGVFVDKVLAATHTTQVDIVGHSQGGSLPRWYMKFERGAAKVHTLVGIAPSNHGTTLGSPFAKPGATPTANDYCAACTDQFHTSSFMQQLNAGGDTLPGVDYTVIETRFDEVVRPYTSAFLTGPRVHNILLQHLCPLDLSDHLNVAFDPIVIALTKNALDPAHYADVACQVVIPPLS